MVALGIVVLGLVVLGLVQVPVTVLPLPQLDLPMQAKPSKPSAKAPVKPTKDWLSHILKDLRVDQRPRPASRAHYAANKEWEGQSSQPKLV
jgi:hypothetical protein